LFGTCRFGAILEGYRTAGCFSTLPEQRESYTRMNDLDKVRSWVNAYEIQRAAARQKILLFGSPEYLLLARHYDEGRDFGHHITGDTVCAMNGCHASRTACR